MSKFKAVFAAGAWLWLSGCSCDGALSTQGGGDAAVPADGQVADAGLTDAGLGGGDAGSDAGLTGPSCATGAGTVTCNPGQRCEGQGGSAECVDNTCADLSCTATERCDPHPQGGHVCTDLSCTGDVQCALAEYCNGTICVADMCAAGARTCSGETLLECASNGSAEVQRAVCSGPANFTSACVEGATTGCSCEGDWDCPAFTNCEVGVCLGAGTAPTCTLAPVPFSDVLPAVEIEWGGLSRTDDDARDGTAARNPAPFAAFSHVLGTPVVANLDDDNGDGLINELDFPEVLFVAHDGNNPWANAVVRAIHGGGPGKGADYFARCGDALFQEGDATTPACAASDPDADAGAPVAVADLNGDGVPEIIYPTEGSTFRILDNTGAQLYQLPSALGFSDPVEGETIAVANLDAAGFSEIIVGRTVYILDREPGGTWVLTHRLVGADSSGKNEVGQMACPADLRSDLPGQEFVAGATLYRLPDTLPTCATPPCSGSLVTVWHAPSIAGQSTRLTGNGFCAVADVWGANPAAAPGPANPPDGVPEVVLIDNGDLTILDAQTGTIIDDRGLGGGSRGGAPNVDDFDGDGFMEVASALQNFYVVVDLQAPTPGAGASPGGSCPAWPTTIARATQNNGSHNPNLARTPGGACTTDAQCDAAAVCNRTLGQCVCLHNGWQRDSDDSSSRATSSSVFDFNGDGAAEVLYNDECDFRVYDGISGEVLFTAMSRSRTGIENPVVADVDNDGNAEVVTVSNTSVGNRCDEDGANPKGPNGIRVWGDPTDSWVSARRIWNQQSYHVVNVTEGGGIPARPPESWGSFNGRTYNTYRSQPRSFGVAPDLTVVGVSVSSPDVACGSLSDNIDITFEIKNEGDLRVGPGIIVSLTGIWGTQEEPLPDGTGGTLEQMLTNSLEPGRSVFLTVPYRRTNSARNVLPDRVRVDVDPTGPSAPSGASRECNEANNAGTADVAAGTLEADLVVDVISVMEKCSTNVAEVAAVVRNTGTAAADGVLVRFYAGDPAQGGSPLGEQTLASIAAGEMESFTASLSDFPRNRRIRIFAVVDPDGTIPECNNANNQDAADNTILCSDLI